MEYLLVRFIGDDILHIVPTKKVSTINEELVHAPYKRMGYYEARPIEYSDDKNYLEKKKEVLEEQASEDNRNAEHHEDSDDSVKDPDYEPEEGRTEIYKDNRNEEHHEDSDDSVKDPDYEPEEGRTEIYKAKSLLQESSAEAKNIQPIQHIAVKHVSGNPDMDYKELELFDTECKSKRHFCIYCKTLHTKFARHLELKHKDEVNVKQFLSLEKKSSLRKKLINDIRVQGDYMYNTSKDYNQNKHLIVVRRPKRGLDVSKKSGDFKPCGNCGGMYSAKSLIQHYRKCMKDRMKGSKDVLFSSKRKSLFISSEVMPVLRNEVLTKLKNDAITETILADPLIILFGNRLCQKYRSPHLHKMIRARLRCVARFVITIKAIQEKINKLEDCYDPEFYDDVIKAINDMCGLNINDGRYKAPATAFAVGSYLMKISFYLTTEYIKRKDYVAQKNIKRFIHLLKDGLSHDVYKTVQENQLEMNRRKKTDLPGLEDIQRLSCYLEKCRKKHYENLEKKFTYNDFKELMNATLISVQIFNRRRAGEVERIKIEDFLKYETVNDGDDLLENMTPEEKMQAKSYVRFLIRGKLGRGVPVMLNKSHLKDLKLILQLRSKANISSENPFLFGIPGSTNYSHLSATKLMNQYSVLCGAEKPDTLRGTKLRKHLATKCATMELKTVEIQDIANYMGHHEKIHINHYRLPNATKDITRMSSILESALGTSSMLQEVPEKLNAGTYEFAESSHPNSSGNSLNCSLNNSNQSCSYSKGGRSSSRKSWSQKEKEEVDKAFKFYLENYEIPPFQNCCEIIQNSDVLSDRTPEQLRAFVANHIAKHKKQLYTPDSEKCRKVVRKRWTEEEKREVYRIFGDVMQKKNLPSMKYCEKVVRNNDILKSRSADKLRAFINNENRKKIATYT